MKATMVTLVLILSFLLSGNSEVASGSEQQDRTDLTYYDYPYYRYGDCNGDGWCNFGDLVLLVRRYQGFPPEPCMPAGDINDDGTINLSDVIALIYWLRQYPGNVPPANECPWEVPGVETGGGICIDNCVGDPGETVFIGAYIQASSMNSFQFSLAYDNEDIEDIFLADVNPIFIDISWSDWLIIRENMPPENDDTLNTVTLGLTGANEIGDFFPPVELPELTWACDFGVAISPSSQGGYHPLLLEADPYFGPPMFHAEWGWDWHEFPMISDNCVYVPGDCDHSGTALELMDVVTMIGMYRGSIAPEYTCVCGVWGCDFAAEADPNGNCIAFELGDVVTEIGAYRGTAEASSCVNCPGSL